MSNITEIPDVASSRTFHQLGVLVLDGSGSMQHYIGDGNRPLADNVNVSVRDFLGFFKNSSIKNNFSIAVVTFDDNATIHTPITPLEDIDDYADYNPVNNGHGGRTFIGGALLKAEELAKEFLSSPEALQNSIDHKVSIIVLSDGLCLKADETLNIANQVKGNDKIQVCTTLFLAKEQIGEEETKLAKNVLIDIASAPNLFKTSYSENDLRQFFTSSLSANTKYGKSDI